MKVIPGKVNKILSHKCPNCYLCGEKGELIYESLKDCLFGTPGYWGVRKCLNVDCGLLWNDPMPAAEDISKLYESYYTHSTNTEEADEQVRGFRCQLKNSILASAYGYSSGKGMVSLAGSLLAKSQFIRDRVGRSIMWQDGAKTGRLLDFGCGNGEFLVVMRNLGWKVQGVEPDQNAAKIGRERYGLNIEAGSIETIKLPHGYFDVVTLSHVVEHLCDPLGTLELIHRLLKKGGRIVLATPNTESLGHKLFKNDWRGLETPRHLFLYSSKNIKSLLLKAGFDVEVVRTYHGSAASIYARSMAIRHRHRFLGENPNDAHGKYYKISSKIFFVAEYILSVRPFQKEIGEELIAVAVKK